MQDVIYDGFSFVENGCVITDISQYNVAERINQLEKRANVDGAVLVQSKSGEKHIPISGYFSGTSTTNAQAMYDTIVTSLNKSARRLILPHAGGTRTYIATPETPSISNPDGLNRVYFTISFLIPDGNAFKTTSTSLINATVVTTPTATIPLTVVGSVRARPFLTFTFTTVTGGTAKTFTIRNSRDFVGLTITRNFVSGDVITVDSKEFQIYINGVLTEPVGKLPVWEPGLGGLYIADTFTTRSITVSGTYIERNQ